MIGSVKFWSLDKGWGFLQIDDEPDLFVHRTALAPSFGGYLCPNDQVQFRIGTDKKTRRQIAVDVQPVRTVSDVLRSMESARRWIDRKLAGLGADEALGDIRHALIELEQIAGT